MEARHRAKTVSEILKDQLRGVKTIYGIVRHISASGMSRVISFYHYSKKDDRMFQLNWGFGELLGLKYSDKHNGLIVKGCGMDMIFHIVYEASSMLYPKDKKRGYRFKSVQL